MTQAHPGSELGIQFGGAEIFDPVPPVDYLLAQLDLCAGAPAVLAGAAFAGKTLIAQALALSIVSGRAAWGTFPVRRGRVVHLDYEQGARLTRERYQRLARAMGLTRKDVGGLMVRCHPPAKIDGKNAEDSMLRAADGTSLIVIDSFRAAAPTVDENSSSAREPLDMLARVSEQTTCAFLVVHHAKKPSKEGGNSPSSSIRGSSALVDAAGSVLVAQAQRPGLVQLTHVKARTSGRPHRPFPLRIDDVAEDFDERWGLMVALDDDEESRDDEGDDLVFEFIGANPGANTREIRAGVEGMANAQIDAAVRNLVLTGRIERRTGKRGSHLHHIVEESK